MKIEIITGADNNPVAEFFSSSSTPETDAVAMQPVDRLARAYTFHGTEPFKYSTNELVPAEFARNLERERDEAREKYDLEATEHMLDINKLCNERDEALNKMADALQEVDLRTLDFERMKEERDDALSQIYQAECRAERFCQERDEAREELSNIRKELKQS